LVEYDALIYFSKLTEKINKSKENIQNFKMDDNITTLAESVDNIENTVNTLIGIIDNINEF
jgi:hypothetical protein